MEIAWLVIHAMINLETRVSLEEWKGNGEYYEYLTGEVYGIITEEYDADTDDWEEKDNCWGFFNDKWGDELIKDVALDFGVSETLYDSIEAVA